MNWEYVFGNLENKKKEKFLSCYEEIFRVMKNRHWYVPKNLDEAIYVDYSIFGPSKKHLMIYKDPTCVACGNTLKYDMKGKAYGCAASPNKLFICFGCLPDYGLVKLALYQERRRLKFIKENKKTLLNIFAEEIKSGEVKL